MAFSDNSYSHMVAGLKIALPLAALAILSSLFLVSKEMNSVTPAENPAGIPQQVHKPGISTPSLSGVTRNGSIYTLSAKEASPSISSENTLVVSEFAGTITGVGGLRLGYFGP